MRPTPIPDPKYVAHSFTLFEELGLSDDLAHNADFTRLFSGDASVVTDPMHPWGWATGYALSIYGTEYIQQCPFGTGNGYGMAGPCRSRKECLKDSAGKCTERRPDPLLPWCRWSSRVALQRARVPSSGVHACPGRTHLPFPTLYRSEAETVRRPWYSNTHAPLIRT